MTVRSSKEINADIKLVQSQLDSVYQKRKGIANWANALPDFGRKATRAFENMKAKAFKQEQELKASLFELKAELDESKKAVTKTKKETEKIETNVSKGETENGK